MPALEATAVGLVGAVLSACGPDVGTPPVDSPVLLGLSTDRSADARGDSLALRLAPTTSVEFNLCHSQIQRWAGRWASYHRESRFVIPEERAQGVVYHCQDIALWADSGDVARYTIRLNDRIEPGTYRFLNAVRVSDSNGEDLEDTLATAPFTVR